MEKSVSTNNMTNYAVNDDLYIWHDREVRFDVAKSQIALRNGEQVFDTIHDVEDTKGNNGDIGTLIFTNLRLIWYCRDNLKINLSVGYECILSSDIRNTSSKVAGETKALAIKCKFNSNRFEFVFNAINSSSLSPELFKIFNLIYKAYDTSRLYRDIKIKGFLTQDKQLITLPGEKVINKIMSVNSINTANTEQSILGTFYLTNVRIIWFSNSLDNFNVSLPWIQVRLIKLKEIIKHGKVISIETGKGSNMSSNSFIFKFIETENMMREIENNYKNFIENPNFGVDVKNVSVVEKLGNTGTENSGNVTNNSSLEKNEEFRKILKSDSIAKSKNKNDFNLANEDVEVIETNYFNEQSNMLYYLTSNQEKKNVMGDIVYSNELGLAIEKLPEKMSLENMWKIIV